MTVTCYRVDHQGRPGFSAKAIVLFAALLALCTTLVVVVYYVNHPEPEPRPDTWSYLYVVNHIQTQGQLVNFWRLPGSPLFIVFILVFTRPEWIYLPVPLFAYLLLMAARKAAARRLLPHIFASVVLLYAAVGGYIYLNATQNHFTGITWIENINGLGKVLQYHMQDEASPQYAGIRHILDSYVAKGILDPLLLLVIWGTVITGVLLAIKYLLERAKSRFQSKVKKDEEHVPV